MATYQQRLLQYELHKYNGDAHDYQKSGFYGNDSDGHDYQKSGFYGNDSDGHDYQKSGFYGNDSGYSNGGAWATEYGPGGAGYCRGGGARAIKYGPGEDLHRLEKPGIQTISTYESPAGHWGRVGGDPFGALVPSSFPPGTDPKFIECFNRIDKDRNGFICDQELQSALSTFNQRFSLRTVHLLMYMFTGSNAKAVGPKEFVPLVRSLQTWKGTFQRYDRDRNGRLDERELKEALMSMGYNVSPFVLKLLISKFDKSGYKCGIEYDYFIECCVVVKGLTEKFRAKEDSYCGTASFTYDEFLLSIIPFIVA